MQEYCPEEIKHHEKWEQRSRENRDFKVVKPYEFTKRNDYNFVVFKILCLLKSNNGSCNMTKVTMQCQLSNCQRKYYIGTLEKAGLIRVEEIRAPVKYKDGKRVHKKVIYHLTKKSDLYMVKYLKLKDYFAYDGLNLFGEGGKMGWEI